MFTSINPHDPADIVDEFEEAGEGGVQTAVAQASKAFVELREQPAATRGGALAQMANDLEERIEELAWLTVREVGKPITEARRSLTHCGYLTLLRADGSRS